MVWSWPGRLQPHPSLSQSVFLLRRLLDGSPRIAQHFPYWLNSESRSIRGGQTAMFSPWSALGGADGDVAIEISGGEEVVGRCTMRQMGNGRSGNVPSPRVFDGQRDPQGDTEIANLARLRESSHFGDFQVDDAHCLVMHARDHGCNTIDHLVQDEGS